VELDGCYKPYADHHSLLKQKKLQDIILQLIGKIMLLMDKKRFFFVCMVGLD